MKILKILFVLVLLAGVSAAGVVALAVWYFGRDLPDYQQLANYQPPVVTRVQAGDGRLMAEFADEKRVFIPVSSIPPLVVDAFLAAEDRNFYTHPGIDPLSMLRAALADFARMGTGRRPEGASTITQQVAKNFLLSNEVSLERKIKEALIAIKMEQALSKDRILELYLNEIYLGGGSYGVAAAALHYFNASLDDLTIEQAAYLAALPKAPNNYNPERNLEGATVRRDWVIDRMVDAGFIGTAAGAAAKSHPLVIKKRDATEVVNSPYFTEEVRRELQARYGDKALYEAGFSVRTSLDPRYQEIAQRSLRNALIAYDRRHGYRGPVTHLDVAGDWQKTLTATPLPAGAADVDWQLAAVLRLSAEGAEIGFADGKRGRIPFEAMRWARHEAADGSVGPVPASPSAVLQRGDVVLVSVSQEAPAADPPAKPKPAKGAAAKLAAAKLPDAKPAPAVPEYDLAQIPDVSGGIVVLDPNTGRILAEAGGFSYSMSQFDRVTQAQRQTGSAIKPIVYLAALDHGFTPSTMVLDGPLVVDQGPGLPKWNPTNYEHKFFGPVPLRVGLEESLNLVTARVGMAVGIDTVGQYLQRFGITDHVPHEYSMLIGAEETTLLKLSAAYAVLDNGGKQVTPTFIDRVQDRNGDTIYSADKRVCPQCSGTEYSGDPQPPDLPDIRPQIADPKSAYQDVTMMEGVILRGTGRAIASLGRPLAGKTGTTNDSNDTWFVGFSPDLLCGVFVGFDQPKSLGRRETGASVAAPAFKEFMGEALKDVPPTPFRIPPGLDIVRVDAHSGQVARGEDKSAIYVPFKPSTEPGDGGTQVVLDGGEAGPAPGTMPQTASNDTPEESDDPPSSVVVAPGPSDVLSPGPAATFVPSPAGTVVPGPAATLAPMPTTVAAPASGTGGLY